MDSVEGKNLWFRERRVFLSGEEWDPVHKWRIWPPWEQGQFLCSEGRVWKAWPLLTVFVPSLRRKKHSYHWERRGGGGAGGLGWGEGVGGSSGLAKHDCTGHGKWESGSRNICSSWHCCNAFIVFYKNIGLYWIRDKSIWPFTTDSLRGTGLAEDGPGIESDGHTALRGSWGAPEACGPEYCGRRPQWFPPTWSGWGAELNCTERGFA